MREEVRNVFGQAHPREHWWMGNFANSEHDVRSNAAQRQRTIHAAENEWRHLRRQSQRAIISVVESQNGGQHETIDEQRFMIVRAEKCAADIHARAGGELNTAVSARLNAER